MAAKAARPDGAGPAHRAIAYRTARRSGGAGAGPQLARHLHHAAPRGVDMVAKPFSVGFRIEHPQGMIDRARWGRHAGHPLLGAADYKLVHHAVNNGRAVYSFCMCPGGTVVAATSEPNRVVTNGMSQYSRNERNANAGIVVGIEPAGLSPRRGHFRPRPLLPTARFTPARPGRGRKMHRRRRCFSSACRRGITAPTRRPRLCIGWQHLRGTGSIGR
jgi:hypothetical protein